MLYEAHALEKDKYKEHDKATKKSCWTLYTGNEH